MSRALPMLRIIFFADSFILKNSRVTEHTMARCAL